MSAFHVHVCLGLVCVPLATGAWSVQTRDSSPIPLAPVAYESTNVPAAPDFTLKDLRGHEISLRQYRGRIVLINFWATWCPSCRTEISWLMELQERFGTRLVVLGVAMDDGGPQIVAPWVQRERFSVGRALRPINYPIVIGSEAVADAYSVESLPATFLIGPNGAEVRRIDGPFALADLERSIRRLL